MKTGSFNLDSNGERITNKTYGSMDDSEKIVLFCPGFPGTNRLVELAPSLEATSTALVEINYRGSKKSDGKFSFFKPCNDIKATAEYLKHEYNPPLIRALGYDMGAVYLTNVVRYEPDLFSDIILLNPVIDTASFFSDEPLMKELWTHAQDILSLRSPVQYKPVSLSLEPYKPEIKDMNVGFNPVHFAEDLKTPIHIVQSTADEVLSPEFAKKFYALLTCKKKYSEIPNAMHDLTGNEEQLIQAIIR
ncbi:Serine aminopeptidase, S33 [uncultured archaeon]|nr:Serine aminopeptidase, S33 [uncultured archaeon]